MHLSTFHVCVCVLCLIACEGQPVALNVISSDDSCQCFVTTADLTQLVTYMSQNIIVTNTKLTKLEQVTARMENKQKLLLEEVRMLKNRFIPGKGVSECELERESNSDDPHPTSSRLTNRRENATPGADSGMEAISDTKDMKDNLTSLFDEFSAVRNMTLEALQENNNIKQELEKEKRVRRSLQTRVNLVEEELNQTQTRVQMINERVTENDFGNFSSSEGGMIQKMVDQIVLVKLNELDGLNTSALENKLKTLEYRVNDVYKDGTLLTERLDGVENMTRLLENGTLIRELNNTGAILKMIEKYEGNTDEIEYLKYQVSLFNRSLEGEIEKMQNGMTSFLDSGKEEMLDMFMGELLQFNDTWNGKFGALRKRLSGTIEDIYNVSIQTERAMNGTKAQVLSVNSTYNESLRDLSEIRTELQNLKEDVLPLLPLVAEIDSVRNLLLGSNALENAVLDVREQLDLRMKQLALNISTRERKENEKMEEMISQVVSMRKNYDTVLGNLSHRLSRLSDVANFAFKQNESVASLVKVVESLRESQQKLEDRIAASFRSMENMLIKEMSKYKEDVDLLKEKKREMENIGDGVPDMRSRSGGENALTNDKSQENYCPLPISNTTEMIMTDLGSGMLPVSGGRTIPHGHELSFTCRHIGGYVLRGSRTLRCNRGQWSEAFPQCQKLLEESYIRDAARSYTDPCLEPNGQFPNTMDCTKYYNCWDGKAVLSSCSNGLHFNAESRYCDYPKNANCQLRDREAELASLLDIIPPLAFSPMQVNAPNSLVATNAFGQLVVFPGTNINLHCLYPRALGEAKWEGTSTAFLSAWETQGIESILDAYKLSLHLYKVSELDSGNYTCTTPAGKMHNVEIIVKGIRCPLLEMETSSPLEIFYRFHPEHADAVMSSQALFSCPKGHLLDGSANVTCLTTGSWSHPTPQCLPDENYVPMPTPGCNKINADANPRLQMDPDQEFYDIGAEVYFTCPRGFRLVGDAFSRCFKNNQWTSVNLPECRLR